MAKVEAILSAQRDYQIITKYEYKFLRPLFVGERAQVKLFQEGEFEVWRENECIGRVFVLANRIVLITGGTRRHRFCLGKSFLKCGDRVIITSKTAESIEQAEAYLVQYKDQLWAKRCDVRNRRTANSWSRKLFRNLAGSIF